MAVYPRVCGGTPAERTPKRRRKGLSPRVRGNHRHRPPASPRARSIPACAGEPCRYQNQRLNRRVYPRVCGGTPSANPVRQGGGGLSPRVRGNRPRSCPSCLAGGSIPACAGEPVIARDKPGIDAVYPRVCGGTGASVGGAGVPAGLSPRVRGNPKLFDVTQGHEGSIPACAGEPGQKVTTVSQYEVYPRVCGGTPH